MKVSVAVLLLCVLLPNAYGFLGFLNNWKNVAQDYIEPQEWKEKLEEQWSKARAQMSNWTDEGKDMAQDYRERAEQIWNEHRNMEPKEWQEKIEKHWETLSENVANMAEMGKDMANDYKEKAQQIWNEHKDVEPKEWKKKMEEHWGKLSERVANMTEMGKDIMAEFKERAGEILDEQRNNTGFDEHMENARLKANKSWRGIKLATKKFVRKQVDKLRKMLDGNKTAEHKVLKELRQTAHDIVKSLIPGIGTRGLKMKPRKPWAGLFKKARKHGEN